MRAAAQALDQDADTSPQLGGASDYAGDTPHYLALLGGGLPLRVTRNVDFDQRRTAPAYADLFLGYALSGSRELQHGVGLGVSFNLMEDGGFTEPVGVASQWVLMPAYMAYWALDSDWLALGHLGVPVLISGGKSLGLELALGLGYRLRAGAGLYAELSGDIFPGASSSLHVVSSLELGIFLDYEVLP